ncbi:MAG TPA: phage major capsid protein [Caldisericia bacterium]|nr:phage major capsid protein [Caldisericia bacterium]HPF48609.1 phage major capsid protein [Caldisericia bacterium]HPI83731.1 phage major capsid protein [Caldisericia bacterium]HPQ93064.1 phage major capsid protein [Caldisericia bacterium]HRV75103.1 phage major capsid protein [Caldisericia bacterium]
MIKNEELLSKAAITSGTFATRVGLSTEDADRFIDYIVDASFLKDNARIEKMKSNTKKLVRLGIGEEVLRPGTYGSTQENSVSVTTEAITLSSKAMKAVVPIGDDALMDNIEGEAFADHLMKMVANQIGNQLEYAYLMGANVGDAITKNHIWEQLDGWYPQAISTGHIVEGSSFSDRYIDEEKLSKAIKTLNSKYRGNRDNLRFVMSDDLYQDFVEVIGNRTTPLGDSAITGESLLSFGRVPLAPCALLPNNLPVAVSGGAASTLSVAATATDTTITVVDGSSFTAGDYITIGVGSTQEIKEIDSVSTNDITLKSALSYDHSIGEATVEVSLDGTFTMLCDYNNLILGIQQDVQIETERRATEGVTYFVVTIRCDCALENPDAVVVLKDLKVK